jgi:hypothetical protein
VPRQIIMKYPGELGPEKTFWSANLEQKNAVQKPSHIIILPSKFRNVCTKYH